MTNKFNLQLFADDSAPGPDIPEELQGLPNQDLVRAILEEEGLTGARDDADAGEKAAEAAGEAKDTKPETKPDQKPEQKPETRPEDLEFWRKKAEQMERAMYEERDKRKKERDLREEAERRLLYGQKPPEQEEEPDPIAQVVDNRLNNNPTLKQIQDYMKAQAEQQELAIRADRSQQAAKQRYADFDDIVAPVIKAAHEQPELARQILTYPDPAEFAYTLGIRLKYHQTAKAEQDKQGQAKAEEQKKQADKLAQIANHPKAGQVSGSSTVTATEIDPDKMTVAEWEALKKSNPKLVQKLLMGG